MAGAGSVSTNGEIDMVVATVVGEMSRMLAVRECEQSSQRGFLIRCPPPPALDWSDRAQQLLKKAQ